MEYKIFVNGLQRSGTNYLTRLILNNFNNVEIANRANVQCASWKHNLVINRKLYSEARFAPNYFILVYKNPYTWLESICCRGGVDYHKTQLLHGDPKKLEGIKFEGFSITHLAKTWSTWIKNWLIDKNDIIPLNTRKYTRYEDLLDKETREKFLESAPFRRSQPTKDWNNPMIGKIALSKDFTKERLEYYKKMMPEKMTQDVLDVYNEYLSDEVLSISGYSRLEKL